MNRRSKFTRLISSLLTLVMIFSLYPTTALASDDYIGGEGGNQGFSGGGKYRANWLENQIGVRISIV